jgi:copper transport protein
MRRFSRIALPAVIAMLIAGLVLAVRQVETAGALIGTAYGRVLLAKLALVGVLLLLALRHRFVLSARLADDAATVRPAFARSLKLEIAVMAALLVLTAGFRLTPPPRALTVPPASRVDVHLHGRHAMADLVVIPGRPGPNSIAISPLDGHFMPLHPLAVTLRLSRPVDGIEPVEVPAAATHDGHWQAGPVHLPPGGPWEVVVDILITDFRKELLGGTITLQE